MLVPPSCLTTFAEIGKGLCAGKGLVIKQDWCWNIHDKGHDLRFSPADLQSYLLTKLAEMACLLLHVLMRVKQQRKVVGDVKVLQRVKECPSDPSRLVFCCASYYPIYHQAKKDCRHDASLTYARLDLEVQAAASHAAGEVVVEALDDLDDAQGDPTGSQNVP